MPKVSVIIPVYNVEKYLGECLDSVLGQTLKDIEVLCVNDGSTDGSGGILKCYAKKDSRLKCLEISNSGAAAARNVGLDSAKGEYAIFLDSDDWFRRAMLAKMFATARRNDCDMVLAGIARHVRTGKSPLVSRPSTALLNKGRPFAGREFADRLFSDGGANPVNKLCRVSFLKRHGIRFQEIPRENDLAFAYLTLAKAERIMALDDAFYNYRMERAGSIQNSIRDGLRPNPHPLCWIEAFRAVKSRLFEDGELEIFAFGLLRALLGTGVRAMAKLAWPDDIESFYSELRREYSVLSGYVGPERLRALDEERAAFAAILSGSDVSSPLLAQMFRGVQTRLALARAGSCMRRIVACLRHVGRFFK